MFAQMCKTGLNANAGASYGITTLSFAVTSPPGFSPHMFVCANNSAGILSELEWN